MTTINRFGCGCRGVESRCKIHGDEAVEADLTLEQWKNLALYMADCHAATLSDEGMLKSTPKKTRERFRSIVDQIILGMSGTVWMKREKPPNVFKRLVDAAGDFDAKFTSTTPS